eukprot:COSAG05_NODE_352_length_10911_cov_31.817139_1_plen_201_part_00
MRGLCGRVCVCVCVCGRVRACVCVRVCAWLAADMTWMDSGVIRHFKLQLRKRLAKVDGGRRQVLEKEEMWELCQEVWDAIPIEDLRPYMLHTEQNHPRQEGRVGRVVQGRHRTPRTVCVSVLKDLCAGKKTMSFYLYTHPYTADLLLNFTLQPATILCEGAIVPDRSIVVVNDDATATRRGTRSAPSCYPVTPYLATMPS